MQSGDRQIAFNSIIFRCDKLATQNQSMFEERTIKFFFIPSSMHSRRKRDATSMSLISFSVVDPSRLIATDSPRSLPFIVGFVDLKYILREEGKKDII